MSIALTVASYIRDRLQLPSYDTKKLQKLLYFSQAWSLAWTGRCLFDEAFEAWPDGPVVRSVWAEQRYRALPAFAGTGLNEDERAVIDSVLQYYGDASFAELVDLTHQHSPWVEARAGLDADAPSRREVTEQSMREYYTRCALSGQEQPERQLVVRDAAPDDAARAGERARDDWREGLSMLADR